MDTTTLEKLRARPHHERVFIASALAVASMVFIFFFWSYNLAHSGVHRQLAGSAASVSALINDAKGDESVREMIDGMRAIGELTAQNATNTFNVFDTATPTDEYQQYTYESEPELESNSR